jgi:hypothetical protein
MFAKGKDDSCLSYAARRRLSTTNSVPVMRVGAGREPLLPDKSIARSRSAASSDRRKSIERGFPTASSDAFQEDRSMLFVKQQREAERLRSEAAFCCGARQAEGCTANCLTAGRSLYKLSAAALRRCRFLFSSACLL